MLIIKGVNVFPSDVEAVVRGKSFLTGEYRIIVDRERHLDTITVEVENTDKTPEEASRLVASEIKARIGVGANVIVLKPNTLPRETHKAKRLIDRRQNVWE
jgi:phenylacetate-CoA ligase